MDSVVKEGIVAGDCVLLSCKDSASILKVMDVDGCQIRLDGKVSSVEGEWCRVLVDVVERGRQVPMLITTRLKAVELTERVHIWSRLNAKTIDRVRNTGTDECDYWVPITSED